VSAAGLVGWTPVHVAWHAGTPVVEWRDLRGLALTDPFFDDTVRRALREPYRLLFAARTPLAALAEVAAASPPPVAPTAFVLHASRCGSTLIAGMLRALDGALMASEPPVLDGILRADLHGGAGDNARATWLRAAVALLGQGRDATRFFVKLDAWSTRDLGLLQATFPDVPLVFSYRDPAEIVASQLRVRGAHMVPGLLPPALFGLDAGHVTDLAPEDYCARVVASVLEAALAQADDRCRLIDYTMLPGAVAEAILPHCGIDPTEEELARMREVAALDAKNPRLFFDPAEPGRLPAVTPAVRAAARRWAADAYTALEARRGGAEVAA
jgi:hypothetical protein